MTVEDSASKEKRRHQRFDCHLGVIIRKEGESAPARTANISASGISLELQRALLAPGDPLEGSCLIPGTVGVSFTGVVRWLRRGDGATTYALGVEFVTRPAEPFYDLLSRESSAHVRRRRPLVMPT